MSTTFWIQLLGIIFGVAMMYFTFVKYKRKEISSIECSIWMVGWIVLIALAIVPSILDAIIKPLNFYRRLDFFVVVGFFTILGLGFYNYSLVKKMERKMEQLVRETAVAHPHTQHTHHKESNNKEINKEPKNDENENR
ncbi:DUF2304 domain-containing protein [Candidatus Woesearchaeota archaeon]|nr:DUF2304 domain-containing protein [Candidatus Woesearchaeota archaeon]